MNLEEMINESLRLMRAADLVDSLMKLKTDEFDGLRKTPEYRNKAYEHHLNGMSMVYYDAAMYMKYLVEVVKKKCLDNREYFKLDITEPNDSVFEMVIEALKRCVKLALGMSAYDGKNVTNYQSAVRQFLAPLQEQWSNDSDKLWKEAEKNKEPSKNAYDNLANAILTLAARDYESAISGISHESALDAESSARMCRSFAQGQSKNYTSVDMEVVFQKIDRNYKCLKDMVTEDSLGIIEEWNRVVKEGAASEVKRASVKYRCPNCGDALRPVTPDKLLAILRIGCCGCNLSVPVPSDVLEKLGDVSANKKHGGSKRKGAA